MHSLIQVQLQLAYPVYVSKRTKLLDLLMVREALGERRRVSSHLH